jgi:hypothetical protein
MPKIETTIEINAPRDRVWEIISDVDHEPEYWWGTKAVKNSSREGNILNREIVQNFGNEKILQKVILRPMDEVETIYLKGVTEGTKLIKIESVSEEKQIVIAKWNIRFAGFYSLMSYFISRHVKKGTIDALDRIKKASESPRATV